MAPPTVVSVGNLSDLEPEQLGELLGLLTHDLRNPLAALSSNVGYMGLVGKALTPELQEALFDLQLSVEAMARLADSLETLGHELRGIEPALASTVELKGLLAGLLPFVERAASSYGVKLQVELGSLRPLRAVEPALARALSNLLHNAVGLAPPASTVRLSSYDEGDHVVLRVEDGGVPLPGDLLDLALSPAGQLALKSNPAGRYSRGLGLYVAARSASLAHASIRLATFDRADSERGGASARGNVFELVVGAAR
ncbi:MAG TPA: HAMP domain-containing sensor histidine kinase [Polyangiaceae bacterium]|nr:HAMP domain-containing sensor histidine kinase [Polyangiaceae bacterium]